MRFFNESQFFDFLALLIKHLEAKLMCILLTSTDLLDNPLHKTPFAFNQLLPRASGALPVAAAEGKGSTALPGR